VPRAYLSTELRLQVRADAGARCGYCHAPEAFLGMPLDIEHIAPEALGGLAVRDNLWLACSRCNDFKGDRTQARDPMTCERVPLFNPRVQHWVGHFVWSLDGTHIHGQTPIGRATVEALRLNNGFIIVARTFVEAGRWRPEERVVDTGAGRGST
jgi:hypothetical protein